MHELKSVPRDVFCLRITMDLRKHPVNILLEKPADQVVNHPGYDKPYKYWLRIRHGRVRSRLEEHMVQPSN